MKRLYWAAAIVRTLALTACSGAIASPTPLPTVVLDAASTGGSSPHVVTASAEIVPVREV